MRDENLTNPWEALTEAGLATATASLQMATSATAAAVTAWSQFLSGPDWPDPSQRSDDRPAAARSTSTAKSWYRAPYRSPFDPTFWLTPGHPVDLMGAWLNPAGAAGAQHGAFGWPAIAPLAMGAWQNPWMAWMQAARLVSGGQPSPIPDAGNIIDFSSAFAAYRTASGHAAAQITRAAGGSATTGAVGTPPSFDIWAWPLMLPLSVWGRR